MACLFHCDRCLFMVDSAASSLRSQCPYCGVGCGLELMPPASKGKPTRRGDDGLPVWGARGDRQHPSSLGQVCVKGATVCDTLDGGRQLQPLYRASLDDPLAPISWDLALDRIVHQIKASLAGKGADAIAMYGSGQFHTEDYYLAQKLLKGAIGTNNFDANSRLCMSSAVAGYTRSLGSDGPPCSYDDLDHCGVAFLIGTNLAECHPCCFNGCSNANDASQDPCRWWWWIRAPPPPLPPPICICRFVRALIWCCCTEWVICCCVRR